MRRPGWSLLSNHGQVLLYVARNPDANQLDMYRDLLIDPRTIVRIIHDLEAGGLITITKRGRSNHYDVALHSPLRSPYLSDHTVGELLGSLIEARFGDAGTGNGTS